MYSAAPLLKFGDSLPGNVHLRAQIERIDALVEGCDPLLEELIDVCFYARKEVDRALGLANRYSRWLAESIYRVRPCEGREARVAIARQISKLLIEIESTHGHAFKPARSTPIAMLCYL